MTRITMMSVVVDIASLLPPFYGPVTGRPIRARPHLESRFGEANNAASNAAFPGDFLRDRRTMPGRSRERRPERLRRQARSRHPGAARERLRRSDRQGGKLVESR